MKLLCVLLIVGLCASLAFSKTAIDLHDEHEFDDEVAECGTQQCLRNSDCTASCPYCMQYGWYVKESFFAYPKHINVIFIIFILSTILFFKWQVRETMR